jgi:hypothetical protein
VNADSNSDQDFEPWEILRILDEEDVHYVLIGGLAAVLHGSSLPTQDVDILPLRDSDNLERLSGALARMGARIRTSDDPVAAPIDAAFLDAMPLMLNLVTQYGDLDIAFDPAGPKRGFSEWDDDATSLDVGNNLIVRVAALADVIDSKTSANRLKDQRALPYLESLRDQLQVESPQDPGAAADTHN